MARDARQRLVEYINANGGLLEDPQGKLVPRIAEHFGRSTVSVNSLLKKLKEAGQLEVDGARGVGTTLICVPGKRPEPVEDPVEDLVEEAGEDEPAPDSGQTFTPNQSKSQEAADKKVREAISSAVKMADNARTEANVLRERLRTADPDEKNRRLKELEREVEQQKRRIDGMVTQHQTDQETIQGLKTANNALLVKTTDQRTLIGEQQREIEDLRLQVGSRNGRAHLRVAS